MILHMQYLYIIQWVFAIVAFATTAGYSGKTTLTVYCTSDKTETTEVEFGYPFSLSSNYYKLKLNGSLGDATYLEGDFSFSAKLFVFLGVITFLNSTVKLIFSPCPKKIRILSDWISKELSKCCLGCMNGTVVCCQVSETSSFAILWLTSSWTWANAVNGIKQATDPHNLAKKCMDQGCKAGNYPSMVGLNASVTFGFFNMILWASGACIKFLYKTMGEEEGCTMGEEEL